MKWKYITGSQIVLKIQSAKMCKVQLAAIQLAPWHDHAAGTGEAACPIAMGWGALGALLKAGAYVLGSSHTTGALSHARC